MQQPDPDQRSAEERGQRPRCRSKPSGHRPGQQRHRDQGHEQPIARRMSGAASTSLANPRTLVPYRHGECRSLTPRAGHLRQRRGLGLRAVVRLAGGSRCHQVGNGAGSLGRNQPPQRATGLPDRDRIDGHNGAAAYGCSKLCGCSLPRYRSPSRPGRSAMPHAARSASPSAPNLAAHPPVGSPAARAEWGASAELPGPRSGRVGGCGRSGRARSVGDVCSSRRWERGGGTCSVSR
jgi:hypothetical protein